MIDTWGRISLQQKMPMNRPQNICAGASVIHVRGLLSMTHIPRASAVKFMQTVALTPHLEVVRLMETNPRNSQATQSVVRQT